MLILKKIPPPPDDLSLYNRIKTDWDASYFQFYYWMDFRLNLLNTKEPYRKDVIL